MADDWLVALEAYQAGKVAEAYAICDELLDQDPLHFGALNMLGAIALQLGEAEQALVFLDRALQLMPHQADILVNRGAALHKLGRPQEAVAAYRQAVESQPEYAHGWYNLGTVQKELGQLGDAQESLQRCVQTAPDYRAGHFNLANTLYELRRFGDSLEHFDRAIELDPQDGEARKNRAFARLMLGDYVGGLDDFEWRWATPPLDKAWQDRGCPQWSGVESLQSKTVLVHAEQGLGDTLQFCRYVKDLKELGAAHVVFEVQKPLLHLMRTVAGADVVVPPGIPMPVYDFHIPLMSLPRAFGITPSTITASIPYLEVPLGKAEQWRSKIEASFFNVGICWQASSKGVEVGRGIPLSAFAPLADCAGVRLYSLQKLDIEVARQPESLSLPLITFGPSFDSEVPFADTAGLMANLDLVITTDTSVAHLAGALGVPVWVALPYVCDWRWGPQSATSPWYPTMRLFRQMERGSWEGCFEQIRWALVKELRARS